jgi:hypothetical protein
MVEGVGYIDLHQRQYNYTVTNIDYSVLVTLQQQTKQLWKIILNLSTQKNIC